MTQVTNYNLCVINQSLKIGLKCVFIVSNCNKFKGGELYISAAVTEKVLQSALWFFHEIFTMVAIILY